MIFDIVIPLGPNELYIFNENLKTIKENVIGYRNIYIITANTNIILDDCIIINEELFPFKMSDIELYIKNKDRNGWYLQQLLKLYAGFYIPHISENYLVIDSDLHFLKKINFFENERPIYTISNEYHPPYFTHMNRMHISFVKKYNISGISHHMIFNIKYIQEIFDIVENTHNIPFWKVFLSVVNENESESGASEYELYFNYVLKYDIIIRELEWTNLSLDDFINKRYNPNSDYVSICSYMN